VQQQERATRRAPRRPRNYTLKKLRFLSQKKIHDFSLERDVGNNTLKNSRFLSQKRRNTESVAIENGIRLIEREIVNLRFVSQKRGIPFSIATYFSPQRKHLGALLVRQQERVKWRARGRPRNSTWQMCCKVRVAVCCRVLQCVAVCCSALQCVAVSTQASAQ